jgi:hypothetical protein
MRYTSEAKILGITFGVNIAASVKSTWSQKLQQLHEGVPDQNIIRLDLQQRIWMCQTWLLAKLWYAAQVLPIMPQHTNTVTSYVTKVIWSGRIFRVPTTTLYKKEKDGGLGMVHVLAKCDAIYINRMYQQSLQQDNWTAQWLHTYERLMQKEYRLTGCN